MRTENLWLITWRDAKVVWGKGANPTAEAKVVASAIAIALEQAEAHVWPTSTLPGGLPAGTRQVVSIEAAGTVLVAEEGEHLCQKTPEPEDWSKE